jgi:hypothetical protein
MAVMGRSGAIKAGMWEIVSSKVFAEMHKTAALARLQYVLSLTILHSLQ